MTYSLAILSRLCLMAACVIGLGLLIVCLVAGLTVAPALLMVSVPVLVWVVVSKGKRFIGWSHGTARFATPEEMQKLWLDTRDPKAAGILLGKTEASPALEKLNQLFNVPWSQSDAVARMVLDGGKNGAWVHLPAYHVMVLAPARAGKGAAYVTTNLLTWPHSTVILDIKGELFEATSEHRRRVLGHQIVVLDPYHVVTESPDTFNPLAHIDKNDPLAPDAAHSLAEAMIVRTGEEKEPHWNLSASAWIRAIIAFVLQEGEPSTRNLTTVASLLSNPGELNAAIYLMQESTAWQGLLAQFGGQLKQYEGKELGSVLTTTNGHLRFISSLPVAASLRESTFDPADLRKRPMSVYLVIPPQYQRTQSGLMRLWITSLLRGVVQGGLGEHNPVLFMLDECASLGHFEPLEDAITQLSGYGFRSFTVWQSIGQLEKCFPHGASTTLLSNVEKVVFGINDFDTAELFSKMLGETTIQVAQEQGGGNTGGGHDHMGQENRSWGSNEGWSVSETARQLLKPDELMNLGGNQALVVARGMRPMLVRTVRYYEPEFQTAPGLHGAQGSLSLLFRCLTVLALTAFLAVGVYLGVQRASQENLAPQDPFQQQQFQQPPLQQQFQPWP